MKFYTKTFFWSMVRNCLAILGMPTGAVAAYFEMNPKYLLVSAVSAMLFGLVSIVFVDMDNNGTVDIFERKRR